MSELSRSDINYLKELFGTPQQKQNTDRGNYQLAIAKFEPDLKASIKNPILLSQEPVRMKTITGETKYVGRWSEFVFVGFNSSDDQLLIRLNDPFDETTVDLNVPSFEKIFLESENNRIDPDELTLSDRIIQTAKSIDIYASTLRAPEKSSLKQVSEW